MPTWCWCNFTQFSPCWLPGDIGTRHQIGVSIGTDANLTIKSVFVSGSKSTYITLNLGIWEPIPRWFWYDGSQCQPSHLVPKDIGIGYQPYHWIGVGIGTQFQQLCSYEELRRLSVNEILYIIDLHLLTADKFCERGSERQKSERRKVRMLKVLYLIITSKVKKIRTSKRTLKRASKVN
jgi:hypothetical protein